MGSDKRNLRDNSGPPCMGHTALAAAEVRLGAAPVLLLIGSTGAGKSTLCEAVAGDARFVSGRSTASVTDWTEGAESRWLGRAEEKSNEGF